MLSKTREQTINIMNEAERYGIKLGEEISSRYNSISYIKNKQLVWKNKILSEVGKLKFSDFHTEFNEMKKIFFKFTNIRI
jgi:hypothetical protein